MFHSARIKLTMWYIVIIMLVSFLFSTIIYHVLNREVERFERIQRFRIERRLNQITPPLPLTITSPELIEETKQRILFVLFILNGAILVISGGLAYFLAGRTLKPIQDMVDEQNRFISDASHELRTPLTSLKSAFEVFLREKKTSLTEAKMIIAESVQEVNTLQLLSESLLQLAQYQKPNDHSTFEKISVRHTIDEAIRKVKPLATRKKIVINQKIDDVEVRANKFSLIDLWVILLDNAIKYSPNGKQISITARKIDGSVVVTIIDRGFGIEKKDLSHIFNRFYRADKARAKIKVNGYGLGLSIAKQIVAVHKGAISVESEKRKGTTVVVKIPFS